MFEVPFLDTMHHGFSANSNLSLHLIYFLAVLRLMV